MRTYGEAGVRVNDLSPHDLRPLQARALRRARKAWYLRDQRAFNILWIGDSISEGYGISDIFQRPQQICRRILQQFCDITGGSGYWPSRGGVTTATPWTYPGATVDATDYGFGLARRSIIMNQATEVAQISTFGDRVWINFTGGTGVGRARILIDSVEVAQVDTTCPLSTRGGWIWDSGLLSRGYHTVRVEPLNTGPLAGYNIILDGIFIFDGEGSKPRAELIQLTTTAGSAIATAASGTFSASDATKVILGYGLTNGGTIQTYTSSSQVTLSANSTYTGTRTVQILDRNPGGGKGVRIWDCAQSGYSAPHFNGSGIAAYWADALDQVQPDLAVIALGTNDETAGRTPAQFQADVEAIVTLINSKISGGSLYYPSILIVPMWQGTTTNLAEITAWWTQQQAMALKNGWAIADLYNIAGDITLYGASDLLSIGMDGLHGNEAGYKMYGTLVANTLLNGDEEYRRPRSVTLPVPSGSGLKAIGHNLVSSNVMVSVRRVTVVNSMPVGEVGIRWFPNDPYSIWLDFDTYNAASGEFVVTVWPA